MRTYDGVLSIAPRLPTEWGRLRFPLRYNDSRILIDLSHEMYRFSLMQGPETEITVCGEAYTVPQEGALELPACDHGR